jgi:nucleoside 2-deoxyribosyltransferase
LGDGQKSIYLIGSLRNPDIPQLGNEIRELGFDVFDDWHAAGPHADDEWKRYEEEKGKTYTEALRGYAARHVFSFDKHHLDRCDMGLLVMPAGKSGHLEIGYMAGKGKPTFVLLEEGVDRWDVMYQFMTDVFTNKEQLCERLRQELPATPKMERLTTKATSPLWQ